MKRTLKFGLALLALTLLTGVAGATNTSSYLDIDVTFTTNLSVAVDNVNSSTYTVAWNGTANQQLFSPSTATVTNDSGVFTERWKLFTNANSMAVTGSGTWALGASTTSVGADQFVVQAVFGSSNTTSCASATSTGTWSSLTTAPILPTSLASGQQYTNTALASSELNNAGGSFVPDDGTGKMYGNGVSYYGRRALCWRVIAPQSTSATGTQNIQVIVAAY